MIRQRIARTIVRRVAYTTAALILALVGISPNTAHAQTDDRVVEQPPDGSEITVSLITVGPGQHVWERFGHNAIWIKDESSGLDRAYNYGLFSFAQEGFVSKFLQGRMEYWMRGFDSEAHLREYVSNNRSVWVQELSLDSNQKAELRDFLIWNERPENRFYRYHYYYDNCSTRIRDALDRVLGGVIRDQTEHEMPGTTLRFHSLRLVSDDFWTYLGLLIGLGQPVDEPISAWEEMFLPLKLREHLRNVVVIDDAGNERPLVLAERTLHTSTEFFEAESPPNWIWQFLGVGVVLAFATLLLSHKATEGRLARGLFSLASALWFGITALIGLGLAGLWLFTDHDTSYRNENLFWFNPCAILLVALAPMLLVRVNWATRAARLAAAFVAGVSLLGFALQILPGMDQVNGSLIALVLPVNVALAAGLFWVSSIES